MEESVKNTEETQIKKKKSILPLIIIAASILAGAVVVYFAFFSQAVKDKREIQTHLANAEKYLDDLDYEKAIAEYEAVLKLNPEDKDTLEAYVDTVFEYAEIVAEEDPEEAAKILADAAEFLGKLSEDSKDIEKQIEIIIDASESYTKQVENADCEETGASDSEDSSENGSEEQDEDETNKTDEDVNDNSDDNQDEEPNEDNLNISISFADKAYASCDGRFIEITLVTDGIQDGYMIDLDEDEIGWLEYSWAVDFTTDGENKLEVATMYFKSGFEMTSSDIYSMQHNLWDVSSGGGSSLMFVDMRTEGNTIIWSFELPEDLKITDGGFEITGYEIYTPGY